MFCMAVAAAVIARSFESQINPLITLLEPTPCSATNLYLMFAFTCHRLDPGYNSDIEFVNIPK
jgi:hypothetical protein